MSESQRAHGTAKREKKPIPPNSSHYIHPNKLFVDADGNTFLQMQANVGGTNRTFRVAVTEVEEETAPAFTRARPGTPIR